jgi:hypothetical protein
VASVRNDVSVDRITSIISVIVASSLILFVLTMEAIGVSETSVLTRATWHHIPGDGNLHLKIPACDVHQWLNDRGRLQRKSIKRLESSKM